jgi:hypothetical protein
MQKVEPLNLSHAKQTQSNDYTPKLNLTKIITKREGGKGGLEIGIAYVSLKRKET